MVGKMKRFEVFAYFLNDTKYRYAICDVGWHSLIDKHSVLDTLQTKIDYWNLVNRGDDVDHKRYEVYKVLWVGSGYEYLVCDNKQKLILLKFDMKHEAQAMADKWNEDDSSIMLDILAVTNAKRK